MPIRTTQSYNSNETENSSPFALEFLTPNMKYPKGRIETIEAPYIELGREDCMINFGDDMPTVSRKHAAIERKGNYAILFNLSKTNQTLVNGRPVLNQYYLNNGDEIQLSTEGPKLRYKELQPDPSIAIMTGKINSIVKQELKPYKIAIIALSVFVLLLAILSGYLLIR